MMKQYPYINQKLLLLSLTPFIIFISCNTNTETKSQTANEIPISIAIVEEKSFDNTIELTGTFFANKEANLGASMPGKVEKFHYKPGSFVNEGDLIVELSAELLTQALIEYEAIKKDFERVERLYKKGSIAEIEYDHLKAKLEASEVKTEMIRKSTSVIAPFDGIIVEYLIEEGENYFFNFNIEPGYSNTSGILRLMQLNPLIINIEVNEKDLKYIKEGDIVKVICEAYPELNLEGTISYIKPILSTISRTATVEVSITNPNLKIKPGMFARVLITRSEQNAACVPINAIYRQPGTPEDYVFKISNNTAHRTRINRLKTIGSWVAVDSVKIGDTIATHGKNRLVNGSKIKITN
ncbi:MAG TPA: efflux RND transporter periplasmic adaptor subunit [Bacteroidales bacterium]|nr:efflux RND transporter periplasmic adaptor subunit [Bacteroidales bacterium]